MNVRLCFVTMAICMCLMPSLSTAYELTGFRWARLPVGYVVNAVSSQELGGDATVQVVQQSYASWANPNCTRFSSQYNGTTNNAWRYQDGVNTLQWIYDPAQRPRELGGPATIGVTLSIFSGNQAVDGDILFNGLDHSWTTNAVRRGQVDAQSIITHEVGHQLGLNHSPFQTATMYAAYLGGSSARTLENDDVNGVCNLYPSGAEDQCQADGECQPGERCLGGSCVPGGGNNGQAGGGTIGEPCDAMGQCAPDHFCVQSPDSSVFCTRNCDGGCPQGWACANTNLGQVCVPSQDGEQPGRRAFGESCSQSSDCASGFCISDGRNAVCSQACGSPNDCPENAECAPTTNGGGACVPGTGNGNGAPAGGGFGAACADPSQCDSQICVGQPGSNSGFCTQSCGTLNDCPAGSVDCVQTQNGSSVCIPGDSPSGMDDSSGNPNNDPGTPGTDGSPPVSPMAGVEASDGNLAGMPVADDTGNGENTDVPPPQETPGTTGTFGDMGGVSAASADGETTFFDNPASPSSTTGCDCDMKSESPGHPHAWLLFVGALMMGCPLLRRRRRR